MTHSREDILPPDDPAFRGSIADTFSQSTADWPQERRAPAGAPNVLVILLDDLGFGQSGCYGGLIDTPHVDRLAAKGLRYTNFHTTGLCSPSRAALLTGRNHHSVGFAAISEMSSGFPGSHAFLPKSAATLAEVLKQNGYSTFAVGKWHLAPAQHTSAAGPFDRWPLGMGFERFYGFLPGETDHWHPMLTIDNHRTPAPHREGYHLSEDLVDQAIRMLRDQQQVATGRPFFMYLAFGAPHCPFHAPTSYIERYRGRFDLGWDRAREAIFERQKALGIVPADAVLPPRNPGIAAWDALSDDERTVYARLQETFAGFVEHTDAQIGRMLEALDQLGVSDNTIVMFMSDNGASQEGGTSGTLNTERFRNLISTPVSEMLEQLDKIGSADTDPHYPKGWGMAGNTPFRRWKRDTHRGGNADPFIVSWPQRIRDSGAIRTHYHHLTDLYPTLLELIGLTVPTRVNGVDQMPLEGVSMAASLFDASAPRVKQVQHYEMLGSRAIWADGWTAVTWHRPGVPWESEAWELYHQDEDFTQAKDLAASRPDKLAELQALWWERARQFKVLPLDDRGRERWVDPTRPPAFETRERYRYYPGTSPVPSNTRPVLLNRSHRIVANIAIQPGLTDGTLCGVGSAIGGWALFVKDGHVCYAHNALKMTYDLLRAPLPLAPGSHRVEFEFTALERGRGTARLLVDGVEVVGASEVRTAPMMTSPMHEGLMIGRLWGSSPAWRDIEAPFEFQGQIDHVDVILGETLVLKQSSGRAE